MSNDTIRQKAAAYATGELSTTDLYDWLSCRRTPIEDDLEADLWGLVFEIGDGEIDEESARRWLAARHGLALTVLHTSAGGGQLNPVTSSGLSNIRLTFTPNPAVRTGVAGGNRIRPLAEA